MRLFLSLFSLLIIIVIGAGIYAGSILINDYQSPKISEETIIHIPKGASLPKIGQILADNDIYHDQLRLKILTRFFHKAESMKAGEYHFAAQSSLQDILSKIEDGDTYQRYVTIPEGLTSWQVKKLLLDQLDIEAEFTMADMTFGEAGILPETYAYSFHETIDQIIKRMKQAQDQVLDEAWENRQDDLPIDTKEEALILASIIEKETAVPDEYEKVAGVFINRLRIGMALQTDPTVIYALTKGEVEDEGMGPLGRRLLRKDLEVDDPYNTYKYPGLTPGPICNPGAKAIQAALNPEDHDYIYFVADGTGGHAFAKTLDGHNANVAKWRKIRASQ